MTKNDDAYKMSQSRDFNPFLAPGERAKLYELLSFAGVPPPSFAENLRATARAFIDDGDSQKLRTVCLLVADLFDQGWGVVSNNDKIVFEPPGISRSGEQTVEDVKLRVRNALNAARARQLVEPSVATFLRRMEHRSVRSRNFRSSILDLVDNGAQLADELASVADVPDEERDAAVGRIIDPVIEICQAGRRCADTGLPLNDIWRYFRHTWAHEYRAIPGRQLLVLIRNAARPKRPVIGIAMLASPVMRVTVRDNWIGWLRDAMEVRLRSGLWHPRALAAALTDRLDDSIAALRWDDLASAGEVASPVENTVLRLEQKASGAAFARDLELRAHYLENLDAGGRVKPMRGGLKDASADSDWRTASEDLLFVRKRSELLAQLLFAKQMFRAASLEVDPVSALDQLLAARSGQRAIDIVLTEFRKAGLSSRVVDVSICGAVQPYNELLGGKLVALLLASKEIRDHYSERYSGQVSVIASQMAGRAVSKPADLRVLTTTSLYGVGSSQYNRLVLKAADHPGLANDLRWDSIGKSKTGGFGTLHLGAETAQALRQMAQTRHDSRRVNNRFGEGTSPRLRQIREGLDALGVDSDTILHHATPRLFYACELGAGSRTSLLGMESDNFEPASAAVISASWRRRWLAARSTRDETLLALRALGPASVQASLRTFAINDLLSQIDEYAPSPA
jgi:hypothetical protein